MTIELTKMSDLLKQYGEWVFRAILLLGVTVNILLTRSFVTRGEFETMSNANTASHLSTSASIADIATTMKLLAANVAKLDDHENRLRMVEMRQIDVIARLKIAEDHIQRIKP